MKILDIGNRVSMKERIRSEQKELESLAEYVIDTAMKEGADEAVVNIDKSTGLEVSCRNFELENIDFNKSRGLGIKVYKDHRTGSANTSDLSKEAIQETVKAAMSIAKHTAVDPCAGLPDKSELAWDNVDYDLLHPEEPDPDFYLESAKKLEAKAMSIDPRITDSMGASVSNHYSISVIANSLGLCKSDAYSVFNKGICVMATDSTGKQQGYSGTGDTNSKLLYTDERIAREAVEKAIEAINPQKVFTGKYPVIFHHSIASSIVGTAINALFGMPQYYKSSFLTGCKGQQVLPSWLTIHSNPHLKGEWTSSDCDADGVSTQECDIFKDGIAVDYLLSCYSARKLGMKTNGHAGGGLGKLDAIDSRGKQCNYYELIKKMDRGVIITHTMGQGVNFMNGDYSVGATGFWVENGSIQYPVSEFTIASNLKDMLMGIRDIGSDTDKRTSINMGSLLIDHMTIAGK